MMKHTTLFTRQNTSLRLVLKVQTRESLFKGLKQVKANEGAVGIDGLEIEQNTYI